MGVDTLREEAAHVEMPTLHRRLEICISLELCLQLRLRTHLPSERVAADSREPTRARCTIIVRRARAASAHGQPHDTSTRGARVRRARECRGHASAAGARVPRAHLPKELLAHCLQLPGGERLGWIARWAACLEPLVGGQILELRLRARRRATAAVRCQVDETGRAEGARGRDVRAGCVDGTPSWHARPPAPRLAPAAPATGTQSSRAW